MKTGNLHVNENNIEASIHLQHNERTLTFRMIGYTLHYGNHFTLKTVIDDQLFSYDGMRDPKLQLEKPPGLILACGDIFGLARTSSSLGNFFTHLTEL